MITRLVFYWIWLVSKKNKKQTNCCWFEQKKKDLDVDSRAIQQIIFTGKAGTTSLIYYIYEKQKNGLRILQRNNKSSVNSRNGWIQQSKCKMNRYTTEKTRTTVKNKTGITLRMNIKIFNVNDLLAELLMNRI